jgi:hypothetical protein
MEFKEINEIPKEPTEHFLMITENHNRWKDLFHSKLIFNQLTDEHVLKILFMQKIKKVSSRITNVVIFLDGLELEDFNLNPKLLNILKYHSELYDIKIQYIDNDEMVPTSYMSDINKLCIQLNSKYNDIEK